MKLLWILKFDPRSWRHIPDIIPDHHPNWYWESWYMVIHLDTITSPPMISMLQLSTKQYVLTNSPLGLSHIFSQYIFKSLQIIHVFPPSFPQSTEDSKLHFFPPVVPSPGAASFCLAAGQGHSVELGGDRERAEQQQGAASATCLGGFEGGGFEGI